MGTLLLILLQVLDKHSLKLPLVRTVTVSLSPILKLAQLGGSAGRLSSPAASHQLFQSLLESCAGAQPRPALHLLHLLQAMVLCGLQDKSVLRVPGPYPTHAHHSPDGPSLDSGSDSLAPFRLYSINRSTGSHNFVPLSLPRSSVHHFLALHRGYRPHPVSLCSGASSEASGSVSCGWATPFRCVLLSPASQRLCTHCCCYAGAKYNPPSGSTLAGRAFGDAVASRDMAWPDREKRGVWGHLGCSRISLTPPQVTQATYPLPSTGSGH